MLYLIFGEDISSSRNKLNELLSGHNNLIRLDGKTSGIKEIDEAIVANNLFTDSKTVVIENFTKIKPADKFIQIVLAQDNRKAFDIILWEGGTLDYKKYKGFKTFEFAFPKVFYSFLDSFSPRSDTSVRLFKQLLMSSSAEQILYSLIKRVRQLIMIKSKRFDFSEFSKSQGWQMQKLSRQASLWEETELVRILEKLFKFDEKMKTGSLTMPLSAHLDILLLSELN